MGQVAALYAIAVIAALFGVLAEAGAQSARPSFPQPAPFDAARAPLSAAKQADMVAIAGGTYAIGAPPGHAAVAKAPAHRVEIAPFRIDRTEVTNAEFAEYLNALPVKPAGTARSGAVGPKNFPAADRAHFLERRLVPDAYPIIELSDDDARIGLRDGRFAPDPGFDRHPVTETTWAGALAYCRWRGARLPTEAEWEIAARGREGRTYPWGEAAPADALAAIGRRTGEHLPVGSRPKGATPEGLLDMAGNLSEWTSSLDRPYPYRADDGRENADHPGERVVRGGDYVFNSKPEQIATFNRTIWSRDPHAGHRHIGFRCAG